MNEKLGKMDEVVKAAGKGRTPNPDEVPAVYCSTGTAGCKDLDLSQMCINCPVYYEYKLNGLFYCDKELAGSYG